MAKQVDVTIGGRPFVCVRLNDADFKDVAAVYVILCVGEGGKWKVLDVGQSGELGSRIDDHDRRECWLRNCSDKNIWVCVYSMPSSQYSRADRESIEMSFRDQYKPPCGKR